MAAKKTKKKVTKKASKKVAKKVTKKASKKVAKKMTKKASKKVAKKVTKKASKKVAKKVTKKASKKVAKKVTKKASKKVAKKVTKKASKKVAKKMTATASASSLVGKSAPKFELQDQNGDTVTSASLKGQAYVLYFYPKDNTPGCTTESCEFRDDQRNFKAAGVTILGVSPDSVKSHAGFASKFELPFTLLSDPEKELAQAYGVWQLKKNYGREYMGIVRSTFLVNKAGKVAAEWRGVRVKGHVEAVLSEARG